MSWQFLITKEAEKDLEYLGSKIKARVISKLEWLATNFEGMTLVPLSGELGGFFKLRVGDWRIVYEIENDKKFIVIHAIDHRDKIYGRKIS